MSSRDVTAELKALLARNRGPDPLGTEARVPPVYGIDASLEDDCIVRLHLTFKADHVYCCAEASCHLPRHATLREVLKLSPFLKLVLAIEVTVEAGAQFLKLDGTKDFERYRASQYRCDSPEW
ncbi:MAG: hypothetical protein ABTQ32_08305 [Myxococcaceae bacterium]